jgi:hypothetical protein
VRVVLPTSADGRISVASTPGKAGLRPTLSSAREESGLSDLTVAANSIGTDIWDAD